MAESSKSRLIRFLQNRARHSSLKRRERYGLDLSDSDRRIIELEPATLSLKQLAALVRLSLRISPVRFINNLLSYLADLDTLKRRRRIQELRLALEKQFDHPIQIVDRYLERRLYSYDIGDVPPFIEKLLYRTTPFMVVRPRGEEDVVELFRFARSRHLAVYSRGVGSSGIGESIPTRNGIVVDLSPLDRIIEIDPTEMTVVVESGAKWGDIEKELAKAGLRLKTAPTSRFSTVGGWLSTGGYGLHGFRHGHISRQVRWLRVIHPTGEIRTVQRSDEIFSRYFHTEGQMGILIRICLEIEADSPFSGPILCSFDSPRQAFALMNRLIESGISCSHVRFLDRFHLEHQNKLYRLRLMREDSILPFRDVVLIQVNQKKDAELIREFISAPASGAEGVLETDWRARLLWEERFMPMKMKKLGPSLLASEVILPMEELSRFVDAAYELGKRFRANIFLDLQVVLTGEGYQAVVLALFTCDRRRFLHYLRNLVLVQMITRSGIKRGGKPYGIGIWNAAYLRSKFSPETIRQYRRYKTQIDPMNILNPLKFMSFGTRFLGIPALMFNRRIFTTAIDGLILAAPVIERIARAKDFLSSLLPSRSTARKSDRLGTLGEAVFQCTNCGACAAVCPAYLVTHDEAVSGRSKLRLAKHVAVDGRDVDAAEASKAFKCIRCGKCQLVCQSGLPLLECWDQLESILQEKCGRPEEEIREFIQTVDTDRSFLARIDDYQEIKQRWK